MENGNLNPLVKKVVRGQIRNPKWLEERKIQQSPSQSQGFHYLRSLWPAMSHLSSLNCSADTQDPLPCRDHCRLPLWSRPWAGQLCVVFTNAKSEVVKVGDNWNNSNKTFNSLNCLDAIFSVCFVCACVCCAWVCVLMCTFFLIIF